MGNKRKASGEDKEVGLSKLDEKPSPTTPKKYKTDIKKESATQPSTSPNNSGKKAHKPKNKVHTEIKQESTSSTDSTKPTADTPKKPNTTPTKSPKKNKHINKHINKQKTEASVQKKTKKKTKWQNLQRDRRPANLRPGGADYKGTVEKRDTEKQPRWIKKKKSTQVELKEEDLEGAPKFILEDDESDEEFESDVESDE